MLLWSPFKVGINSSASSGDGQGSTEVSCSPGARADGVATQHRSQGAAAACGVVQQQVQGLSSVPVLFLFAPGEAPELLASSCGHQHVCLWVHMATRRGGNAAAGSCSLWHLGCCVGAGAPGSLH